MNPRVIGCVLLGWLSFATFVAAAPPEPFPPGQVPYIYECGRWWPHQPSAARGLFDVSWPQEELDAAARERVRAMGGVIVHEFNVCAVRARLWVARIPFPRGMRVESVASPPDYSVNVVIAMPTPLSSADRAFLAGLGAEVTLEATNQVHARVPDESIAALRAYAGVESVRASGSIGCF